MRHLCRPLPGRPSHRQVGSTMLNASFPIALCLGLTACSKGVLDPAGPVGKAERTIMLNAATIMLAIIVPTILATLVFAWWFRSGNARARRQPDFVYSGRIELMVWSIPLVTIMLLGGITWIGAHALDPARPLAGEVKPVPIEVVSLDWKWLFIHPDAGIASVNRLAVPTGTPLQFTLTSGSIMTVFFVPRFGSMIYVMNGMSSRLNLQVDEPGLYRGIAAHIAGDGFPDMHFEVEAMAPAEYAAWVAGARGRGPALDHAAYADLSRQSILPAPLEFGMVEAGLYDAIVMQHLPPGPGPKPQSGIDGGQTGAARGSGGADAG